ncbi:ShlB/FhaC/HecB family hemolysin secretion/activation protein [Sinisalibacter lacisalsi]|uniref:Haemolysin activator HlyB C-terminal domain-containing protein n=1 Tax=Sinisalibacter lacisalsi TaxID=1526570 RepID=A0ABQ1QA82_9RHOB|nr:ShlB/FhaC/HecB family hemolysin secretion/activation protein [Sinisalibacter lacisalsi]GGD20847.1 hypothetical protein GCM10011358_01770 [Sinisalibacter lacisalsi]
MHKLAAAVMVTLVAFSATAQDAAPIETTIGGGDQAGNRPSDAAIEAAEEAVRAAARATERAVAPAGAGEARMPPGAALFVLREIRFTPSGYLEASSLAAIEATLLGRRFRADDLSAITDAVARVYAERGIVLAQPIVTGVDPANGRVEVELFEARIGAVRVASGLSRPEYYRWRLGLRTGDLADTRIIDARLNRLALTDGVAFDANFVPGSERGQTDLVAEVSEPKRLTGEITADNYGTPAQGTLRLGATLRNAALTGWNDPLALSISRGAGALSLSASYGRVITPSGAALSITAGYDRAETRAAPRVETQTRFAELSLAVPTLVEERRRVSFGLGMHWFSEQSDIAGAPLLDQAGGYLSLGTTAAWFGDFASIQVSQALRLLRYDDAITGATGIGGVLLPGDLTIAAPITRELSFSLRAGWQLAVAAPLPARFKFSSASPYAVRGYPTGLQSGDSGWFARAQFEYALPAEVLPEELSLTPFVFADTGEAHDYVAGRNVGQGRLASAGIGMSMTTGEGVFADAFVARPLRDVPGFTAGGRWSAFARVGLRF